MSAKNRSRAIAVVDVAIHRHRGFDLAVLLQAANRHCHIVNHAETFTMVGERMMKSAADIYRYAVRHRPFRRQDGAARRQPEGAH